MTAVPNVVELSQQLIRCPSITPIEGGALALLEQILTGLGFTCHRMTFSDEGIPDVENLYARLGNSGPNFCYAGHTDVVPVGDAAAWKVDPFGGEIIDDVLYGRGAVDMKGSIACFVTALASFLERRGSDFDGSISLLITGDEEDICINGTRKVLQWMAKQGETLNCCLVGEPTSNAQLGDMIKIGRRGSMNGKLTVHGTQGHTAYPQLADNPIHSLVQMLHAISTEPLDGGSEHFPPTSLQVTSIDVGNPVTNVIPADAKAMFNIRFNDLYSSKSVHEWVRERLDKAGGRYDLDFKVSGESFLSAPGPFSDLVAASVAEVMQQEPELGTTGGTSDARFIKDFCPVAELGLLNDTAHKVDEQVPLSDLKKLEAIYGGILEGYFKA